MNKSLHREEEIIKFVSGIQSSDSSFLYEDEEFPPDASSLYVDPSKLPEYANESNNMVWYRPNEYTDDGDYFKSTSGCGIIKEGPLNDAWLLGVFAALAVHPDNLIENLFVSELHDFKQYGVYTCRFYKDAKWVEVTTDTRLPYSIELNDEEKYPSMGMTTTGSVLYGASLNKNELFLPFLLKAYAKIHGNYQKAFEKGRILEGFLDCTGGSGFCIDLVEDKNHKEAEDGTLWKRLQKYHQQKTLLTCQLQQLAVNAFDPLSNGIIRNRQYIIMYIKEIGRLKMIKLKTVWGRGMWKGEWSNDDSKWKENIQVESVLRQDPSAEFSRSGSDGCFWMIYEDFIDVFNEIYVFQLFDESTSTQYCVRGEWKGHSAAGAPSKTSNINPSTLGTPASYANGLSVNTMGVDDPGNLTTLGGSNNTLVSSPPATGTGTATTTLFTTKDGSRLLEKTKWIILPDAEPAWFRNQQFRLTASERTQVSISLLQRDFRMYGGDNFAINFVVLKQKKKMLSTSTKITWELQKQQVIAEAHSYDTTSSASQEHGASASTSSSSSMPKQLPERELFIEEIVFEPEVPYLIVPYTDNSKVEMEFFLRIFANKPVRLESLPLLYHCSSRGKWRRAGEEEKQQPVKQQQDGEEAKDTISASSHFSSSNAGGPLCKNLTHGPENPSWCQNPQLFLRTIRSITTNTKYPSLVNLKIIVKKTSYKAQNGTKAARQKDLLKDKGQLVGFTVVKAITSIGFGGSTDSTSNTNTPSEKVSTNKGQKTNFLGEVIENPFVSSIPKKQSPKSSLKSGTNSQGKAKTKAKAKPKAEDKSSSPSSRYEEKEKEEGHTIAADESKESNDLLEQQSKKQLLALPAPKLVVHPEEWCRISEYSSPAIACMYLRKIPREWLDENQGLLIVPSLGEVHAEGSFEVEVDCEIPLSLTEIPRFSTQSLAGEWNEDKNTAGGCHLHEDWKKNPKFFLQLKGVRPARVTITLTRSELEWKTKCRRDAVGTMVGFYLFSGQKLSRETSHVQLNGRPWTETDFVPLHSVTSPPDMILPSMFHDPYVIMPATYDPNKSGKFVLSVKCDTEFTLTTES